MSDPTLFFTLACAGTVALAMASMVCLKAWHEWLDLRRLQLAEPGSKSEPPELSELRARVRRLETIANGTSA